MLSTDIFGIQITFLDNGRSKHQTFFGGLLTVVLFGLVIVATLQVVTEAQTNDRITVTSIS